MAKFLIETLVTLRNKYVIEVDVEEDDVDAAYDAFFEQEDTLQPIDGDVVGQLISDVDPICEEHYQDLIQALAEVDIEQGEKLAEEHNLSIN